ncbi:hypothetical protein TNCT_94401 [Trichonephila clavata]|uniref:Uncharacterized protein n=1 Tax=Trichonephila clavata TaxID=2740835 RepID=A0A8X6FEF0_TRICU|nr:hypothetical protein TNCT_94401 [Trichonephila clavata]
MLVCSLPVYSLEDPQGRHVFTLKRSTAQKFQHQLSNTDIPRIKKQFSEEYLLDLARLLQVKFVVIISDMISSAIVVDAWLEERHNVSRETEFERMNSLFLRRALR